MTAPSNHGHDALAALRTWRDSIVKLVAELEALIEPAPAPASTVPNANPSRRGALIGIVSPAPIASATRPKGRSPNRAGPQSRVSPAMRDKLRAGWEAGMSPATLVASLGLDIGPTWLNHAAKRNSWGPRGSKAATTPRPPLMTGAATSCYKCNMSRRSTPCEHCGSR